MEREFIYPRTTEVPIPHFVPQHDDFADTLSLNYEEIEPNNVAEYALALVGIKPITPIDTTGMEFVPERGQLKTPDESEASRSCHEIPPLSDEVRDIHIIPKTPDNAEVSSSSRASTEVDTPIIPNLYYLDDYRMHGGDAA